MVKPTELLDFGMLGVCLNEAFICISRPVVLTKHTEKKKRNQDDSLRSSVVRKRARFGTRYGRVRGARRIAKDAVKAVK